MENPSLAQPVFSPYYLGMHLENVKCRILIIFFHCVIFVQTWFCVMSIKLSGKCRLPPRKLKYRIKNACKLSSFKEHTNTDIWYVRILRSPVDSKGNCVSAHSCVSDLDLHGRLS